METLKDINYLNSLNKIYVRLTLLPNRINVRNLPQSKTQDPALLQIVPNI